MPTNLLLVTAKMNNACHRSYGSYKMPATKKITRQWCGGIVRRPKRGFCARSVHVSWGVCLEVLGRSWAGKYAPVCKLCLWRTLFPSELFQLPKHSVQ